MLSPAGGDREGSQRAGVLRASPTCQEHREDSGIKRTGARLVRPEFTLRVCALPIASFHSVNKGAFQLHKPFPSILPTLAGYVCHRTSKTSYARFRARHAWAARASARMCAPAVFQLFTRRERRLIVVWWRKSSLSAVAGGGGTSHALVCTRSPLTFQSEHINTALTWSRPLPEPPSCYTKTRPVFHC